MNVPLLQTKLYIPAVHAPLVKRSRLVERLNAIVQYQLGLLSAPAGFGKTTLVAQWIHSGQQSNEFFRFAWLSVDKGDNEPVRFLTYLSAALHEANNQIDLVGQALSHSQESSDLMLSITLLINQLAALPLDQSICLILDDYHNITERVVHDALNYLVEHCPPQLRIILTTRVDPPLPLPRLRLQNQLLEIRANDLRFTLDESTSFLQQMTGEDIASEQLRALDKRTEGWIASLQAAALTLQNQKDVQHFISTFSASNRFVFDYLITEVLAQQSERLRLFLTITALFERFCAPLCDALLEEVQPNISGDFAEALNSQEILLQLEQANLFLVPLDQDRIWYRYHHLFAELLQHQLQQHTPLDVIHALHLRASRWFANQGMTDEAIEHAILAQDFDHVAGLLSPLAFRLLWAQGAVAKLRHWLSVIPDQTLQQVPNLALAGAYASQMAADVEGLDYYLHLLASAPNLPPEVEWGMSVIQVDLHLVRQDRLEARKLFDATSAQVSADYPDLLMQLKYQMAGFHLRGGNVSQAQSLLTDVVNLAQSLGSVYHAVAATVTLANMAYEQGDLHSAFRLCNQARTFGTEAPDHEMPAAGWGHLGLGAIMYEWNKIPEAVAHYEKGVRLAEQAGVGQMLWAGYREQVQLYQRLGDVETVDRLMQKLHSMVRRTAHVDAQVEPFYRELEANIALQRDNLEITERWIHENQLQLTDRPDALDFRYWIYLRYVIQRGNKTQQDRVLDDAPQYPDAIALAHYFIGMADEAARMFIAIRHRILLALLLQLDDQKNAALNALKEAIMLAQSGGYIRTFVDFGLPMLILLQELLKKNFQVGYVQILLQAFEVDISIAAQEASIPEAEFNHPSRFSSAPITDKGSLIEPLTDRELEVLQLVCDGLRNQEIANQLVVSIGTTKRHLANIYGKLGVNSRTQAIVRTRELNLL
ncbi:LuxR C-terminal-related transcriptional regulator [Chloroflexi bacterium TSY]|nr:LuxR C-terminal-related transcriptional regulator [Chloroflexi bacterium TSY]